MEKSDTCASTNSLPLKNKEKILHSCWAPYQQHALRQGRKTEKKVLNLETSMISFQTHRGNHPQFAAIFLVLPLPLKAVQKLQFARQNTAAKCLAWLWNSRPRDCRRQAQLLFIARMLLKTELFRHAFIVRYLLCSLPFSSLIYFLMSVIITLILFIVVFYSGLLQWFYTPYTCRLLTSLHDLILIFPLPVLIFIYIYNNLTPPPPYDFSPSPAGSLF